ncbi:hypothetical protein HPP92_000253 [Vanilla planifolia]|uniref:Mitochondrial transcription termination factor family protein n=1 Tax=Vanilla planifolia TaxID=51239 RepID=A0A835RXN7_VANPL|nr:hypothetical protein HPP92_000253 [Vanilla planifolia]
MLVFRGLEIKFPALGEKYSSHARQWLLRSYSTDISRFHLHQPVALPPQLLHRRLIPSRSCLRFSVVRWRLSSGGNGLCSSEESEESSMEEAREAIAELLGEYGVSEDDRRRIAYSSPHYLEMIVGNVLELDENLLWGSWKPELAEEVLDVASFSFKRKVRCMAESKRDYGVLPFLESLGVRQSSAMFIARYLVGERLPDLIDKVKFVKQMLVSSSSTVIEKNARRMMMYLSIFADEDIQGTLAFFEKMEARYGGLTLLDQGDSFVSLLIESFPRLLMLSVENHLKPLVDFLVFIGVPITSIRNILLLYPPIFFYDVENNIIPRLDALKKAGLEDKYVAKVLIKYPWVLSSSVQQNYDKIVMFFARRKVPKQSVDIAIRSWPHILGCSTYKMKLVVEEFGELSVHARHLVPVITSSPQLLLRNPEEFLQRTHVEFLKYK